MKSVPFTKIRSQLQLYEILPEHERIIVDVLREIIKDQLQANGKEKISYNVPFFYGNKSICLVWPSTVPGGGIKKGVMLAFWYGNRLADTDNFLTHGTNKQIFYKIYNTVDEINIKALTKILNEAVKLDNDWKKKNSK